jgi:hypothetical protein
MVTLSLDAPIASMSGGTTTIMVNGLALLRLGTPSSVTRTVMIFVLCA